MDNIYLDNAATTQMDKLVVERMCEVLKNTFGNPSSTHVFGREAKVVLEESRRTVASLINAKPSEIFFTSCATESINTVLKAFFLDSNTKNIITSPLEHPANLQTIKYLKRYTDFNILNVDIDDKGMINYDHLEELLSKNSSSLLSLMHVNNELGNVLDVNKVSALTNKYNIPFLCDMVQSMAKFNIDLQKTKIDFTMASSHKFHGPKGVGFLYINEDSLITPMIFGGNQERKMRSGTENLAGIAGLAKAMEIAYDNFDENKLKISNLKKYAIKQLKALYKDIRFNGDCEHGGADNILNFSLVGFDKSDVLAMNLDMQGIAISGGSACNSGSVKSSYVLHAIKRDDISAIRLSLSKYNSISDIDTFIKVLKQLID